MSEGFFIDIAMEKTIAAICTAPGAAGISVVRVSGKQALELAAQLCPQKKLKKMEGGSFFYTTLHSPTTNELIDEAIVLVYRAPHSYTGEDTVELQVHGGHVSSQLILKELLSLGAISASAGEFTCRAFLNGRLDLSRAEAVLDIINAQSERAGRIAAEQLCGSLGKRIDEYHSLIMDICADVEATLDFMDDETSGLLEPINIPERLQKFIYSVRQLAATWRSGQLLREGALLVLSGVPNAGKSTLFNALIGQQRAIVTDIPGTTRDSIEEHLIIDGIPIRLADTAGLRETDHAIEQLGINRTKELAKAADICLAVIDGTQPLEPQLAQLQNPDFVVLNKADAFTEAEAENLVSKLKANGYAESVIISAKTEAGLTLLRKQIASKLQSQTTGNELVAVSERHHKLLVAAADSAEEALLLYEDGLEDAAVFCAQKLREAAEALAAITGKNYNEALLNNIFSKFCIGK
jgi:tRNA modification GTPase